MHEWPSIHNYYQAGRLILLSSTSCAKTLPWNSRAFSPGAKRIGSKNQSTIQFKNLAVEKVIPDHGKNALSDLVRLTEPS